MLLPFILLIFGSICEKIMNWIHPLCSPFFSLFFFFLRRMNEKFSTIKSLYTFFFKWLSKVSHNYFLNNFYFILFLFFVRFFFLPCAVKHNATYDSIRITNSWMNNNNKMMNFCLKRWQQKKIFSNFKHWERIVE